MNYCKPLLVLLLLPFSLFASDSKPNFVFLLVDDVGWGDFGCYGAEFNETPNIDRLAEDGMLFSDGYAACTVCSPSRAAILTGQYPGRTRLSDWIPGKNKPNTKLLVPDWEKRMSHDYVLLPEALQEGGYATIFLGKWHLMPHKQPDFDEHYPTSHGFDINIGGREWGQPRGRGKYFSPFDMPNLDDGEPGDFLTDKLTDAAIDYLDSTDPEQPFLMYFSYYTLHGPIMAPEGLVKKYEAKAASFRNTKDEMLDPERAAMVESLDDSIGRIMVKLEELGIADNTVIILTGDNGGNFRQTSGGFRDFKGYSHEGGVREPFVVKWPGVTKPGSTCDVPVTGTDFYPTMLEMAGLSQRPADHVDGVSLVPLLAGTSESLDREALYWHYPHYHRTEPYGAIRRGEWKLIEFFETGELELFDLVADPGESNNLAASRPELADQLLKQMQAWRVSVDAQMMEVNPDYSATGGGGGKKKKKKNKKKKKKST